MKSFRYILGFICVLFLIGCNQQSTSTTEQQAVTFTVLAQGTQSGFNTDMPTAYKLDNEKDWQTFWDQHNSMMEPKPALPAVDFSQNMVVAIIDANQPSGGYQITVDKITAYSHRLHITATRESPGANCMTMGAITQPFIFVTVPQSQDVPELHLNSKINDCN